MDVLLPEAMAGTQRRQPSLSDPMFAGLSGSAEQQLLSAAAVAGIAAVAGQQSPCAEAMEADPEPDTRRLAPSLHLQRILEGEFRVHLPEWLELACQGGWRADPIYLPQLLEIGRSQPDLRALLAAVCGPRGGWLARHNKAWDYLLGHSEDLWETGRSLARVEWFGRFRQAQPEEARKLLITSFPQESADDRQKLLLTLVNGLSMGDEEFLESALDDRSKGVRAQAAQLLARLPASRLAQRARARTNRWLPEKEWEVHLPDECSREMQRDGIELKSPHRDLGDRAWWLLQNLARTPLDHWHSPPGRLLAWAAHSEWAVPLVQGWKQATLAQAHLEWAQALIDAGSLDPELFALLPEEQREKLLINHMREEWLPHHGRCSPHLAQVVIDYLRQRTAQKYQWPTIQLIREVALWLPPEMGREIETGWPEDTPDWAHWRSSVDQMIGHLQFRQSLHEELSER